MVLMSTPGAQQVHGSGMPNVVRANAFALQGRYTGLGLVAAVGDNAVHAKTGHVLTGTFNYPCNNHCTGHDGREIAVTMPRNVGHDTAKSPVTMT